MAAARDKQRLILEQAARWHLWLRDHDAEPAEMEIFQRWCERDARHREAYEQIRRMHRSMDGIDALDLPWPTELELNMDRYDGSYALPLPEGRNPLLDQVVADFEAASGDFVLQRIRSQRRRHWSQRMSALAASIMVVGLAASLFVWQAGGWFSAPENPVYVTGVAQQRSEQLEDGSTITLGGNSRLSVAFTPAQRTVVLERGEAFFQVAKDAQRPFVVMVDGGEVRAVGTAFNINRRQHAVTVSVIEGVVDVVRPSSATQVAGARPLVAKERLAHGQQLRFDHAGGVWQANRDADLERAVAWREGRLAFINERLDSVIEDVNRYSARKLVIGDPALGELRYTGTVFNTDVSSWLSGLQKAFNVRTLEIDNQVVLIQEGTGHKSS